MRHPIKRTLSALGLALLLAGCASLAPGYQRPEAPVPAAWPATAAAQASAAPLQWQDFVTDERLRALVAQALRDNRDLRQTLLNVEAVRAQYQIQRADRVPSVGLQGNGTRQRTPADLSGSGRATTQGSYQVGLGVTAFELDLFGRVRSLSEAALQDYLATESGAQAARISLVGQVIETSLQRDGALRRLQLAQQTLQAREQSLQLTAQRRAGGAATALDHQEALGLAEQARAERERTQRELDQASNALRLLVGSDAPDLGLSAASDGTPLLVQDIAAGAPSDLLARRPDIVAAEQQLRARHADIGAARAAFFPRITLTGLLGSSSTELSSLFRAGQGAWSFAPQLSLPIFDGGRNQAGLELAQVRKDAAVARYEGAVQTAFREVADALAATDTLRREEAARLALVQSSQEALRLAEARYRGGVDSHLRYLEAQRSAYASQQAYIETSTQRQMALATLFRALGGGWSVEPQGGRPAGPSPRA